MSAAPHSTAALESSKRPRHDPEDDETDQQNEQQSATHSSPVARLYRHALSPFYPTISFVPLQAVRLIELHVSVPDGVVSQLSHAQLDQLRAQPWLPAMCVDGISELNLKHLIRSPHALQWQQISEVSGVDDEMADALSHLPSLTELRTQSCRSVAFLSQLVNLRMLSLFLEPWPESADEMVGALLHCPLLEELCLCAPVTSANLSALLPSLPHLRDLELYLCRLHGWSRWRSSASASACNTR